MSEERWKRTSSPSATAKTGSGLATTAYICIHQRPLLRIYASRKWTHINPRINTRYDRLVKRLSFESESPDAGHDADVGIRGCCEDGGIVGLGIFAVAVEAGHDDSCAAGDHCFELGGHGRLGRTALWGVDALGSYRVRGGGRGETNLKIIYESLPSVHALDLVKTRRICLLRWPALLRLLRYRSRVRRGVWTLSLLLFTMFKHLLRNVEAIGDG
jgi:hypothetical protein